MSTTVLLGLTSFEKIGGQWIFGGASDFSNLLAPWASGSRSLMLRAAWDGAGLCSNAFDCPVVDSFALAFDSSAFALAFDSNAFDWNQIRIKCESNETVHYCCSIMFIFLVGFVWNKPQEDQHKQHLIALSESAHKDRSNTMCEWLSCLDSQRIYLVLC